MTDEQIALIKYAIRTENKKTAQVLGKLKVPVDDYESPLEKALRAAMALADQARAMDGWVPHVHTHGEIAVTRSPNGKFTVDKPRRFMGLSSDGDWVYFEKQARFDTFAQAIAAANAVMKAGDK
jgi:hypothetical protein